MIAGGFHLKSAPKLSNHWGPPLSDAFDTLRTTLPNKRALHIKDALIKMKTEDEGLFNPFLIDNFIRSMHLALSG